MSTALRVARGRRAVVPSHRPASFLGWQINDVICHSSGSSGSMSSTRQGRPMAGALERIETTNGELNFAVALPPAPALVDGALERLPGDDETDPYWRLVALSSRAT